MHTLPLRTSLVAFFLLALGACALSPVQDAFLGAAYRSEVARYIDESDQPDRTARRIERGAGELLSKLDAEESVALTVVEERVRERFDYPNQPFYKQQRIDLLIEAVKTAIEASIEQTQADLVTGPARVKLIEAIEAARQVARAYQER